MSYKNYMEEAVLDEFQGVVSRFKNICTCELCREDIIAFALNRLPPRYVVTKPGHVFTRYEMLKRQSRADISRELAAGALVVSLKPRHKVKVRPKSKRK